VNNLHRERNVQCILDKQRLATLICIDVNPVHLHTTPTHTYTKQEQEPGTNAHLQDTII